MAPTKETEDYGMGDLRAGDKVLVTHKSGEKHDHGLTGKVREAAKEAPSAASMQKARGGGDSEAGVGPRREQGHRQARQEAPLGRRAERPDHRGGGR
jgi:type IV secretory pathway TrbL component